MLLFWFGFAVKHTNLCFIVLIIVMVSLKNTMDCKLSLYKLIISQGN